MAIPSCANIGVAKRSASKKYRNMRKDFGGDVSVATDRPQDRRRRPSESDRVASYCHSLHAGTERFARFVVIGCG
jgi:hypothetical protein